MTAHAWHKLAANYSPAQVVHDSCEPCAERGEDILDLLAHLDDGAFAAACERADAKAAGRLHDVSEAEAHFLDVLHAFRFRLAMLGLLREKAVAA